LISTAKAKQVWLASNLPIRLTNIQQGVYRMRVLVLYAVSVTTAFVWGSTMVKKQFWTFLFSLCVMFVLFPNAGHSAHVTLAWDPNREPDIAGYRIYYGTGSRVYNWFVDVGNDTNHTITGLPDGSNIYFAATAYSTSGSESTYSYEVFWSDINADIPISEITIGTKYTITGSGFGSTKGKVLIGNVSAKVNSWTDDAIIITANRVPLPAGPYDVVIKPNPKTDISPLVLPGAFTVTGPEIVSLSSDRGAAGDEIIVTGKFFSSKAGKVYLKDPVSGKSKNCKVVDWSMDPSSGDSTLTFVVPILPKGMLPDLYPLKIVNKVKAAETTFTIESLL
jgi:hypothetical protein